MSSRNRLLSSDITLPSPPAVAIRILEAVKKEKAPSDELARIISADPALAAKILKVANSSIYALPFRVDSIKKAITILGIDALKNVALSFVIATNMVGSSKGGFDFELFWKRSLTAAVGAECISGLLRKKDSDIFATALLQDIGILIMYMNNPEEYLSLLKEKHASNGLIFELEKSTFGFDHQEIGSYVLKNWGLPESIYLPIRYHHENGNVPEEFAAKVDIMNLADRLSAIYHGSKNYSDYQLIKKSLCDDFNTCDNKVDEAIDSVCSKSIEIFSFFELDPGDIKPLSQILQEANEELGKLNLSYEQLVVELKRAKERAEALARELREANERLKELVFRDGLTGLYNHAYFQDLMDRELNKAIRYKRAFSLIMFDLDHFKQINDQHGHPVGDIVLKELSRVVTNGVRQYDAVARYGGEEFAIILPETDLEGAATLGERLRKAVEGMEVPVNGATVKTTISVGITTWVPGSTARSKMDIIASADKALYYSKNTGRNKTSVLRMN
jgi:diguanylate cyclase (GGDEF)-like protein